MKKLASLAACLLLVLSSLAALSPEDSAAVSQVQATAYNNLAPAYPTFERFGLDMKTIAAKKPITMSMLYMVFQNYRQALQFGGNANTDPSQAMATIRTTKDLDAETLDKLSAALVYFEDSIRTYFVEKKQTDAAYIATNQKAEKAERANQELEAKAAAEREEQEAQEQEAAVQAAFIAERDRLFQIGDSYGLTAGYIPSIDNLFNGGAVDGDITKYMLIPSHEHDDEWIVVNQIGDYVIYMAGICSLAVVKEKGRAYLDKSHLDLNSYYRIDGTKLFQGLLGGTKEIFVISRLGPKI